MHWTSRATRGSHYAPVELVILVLIFDWSNLRFEIIFWAEKCTLGSERPELKVNYFENIWWNNYSYRSSGHVQSAESCSIPKLWPISWAIVAATSPITLEWSIDTPPENSYVQIGPLRAFPTTPSSKCTFLKDEQNLLQIFTNMQR